MLNLFLSEYTTLKAKFSFISIISAAADRKPLF